MSAPCPTCGKPLDGKTFSEDALIVLGYWQEKTGHQFRTEKASERAIKRIDRRLKEGFSVADLCRAVDVAIGDSWYRQQGYHKQPEVIWRDAERVESLLARVDHERERPIPL